MQRESESESKEKELDTQSFPGFPGSFGLWSSGRSSFSVIIIDLLQVP